MNKQLIDVVSSWHKEQNDAVIYGPNYCGEATSSLSAQLDAHGIPHERIKIGLHGKIKAKDGFFRADKPIDYEDLPFRMIEDMKNVGLDPKKSSHRKEYAKTHNPDAFLWPHSFVIVNDEVIDPTRVQFNLHYQKNEPEEKTQTRYVIK